jgi:glycosyltransferase 2 family protein
MRLPEPTEQDTDEHHQAGITRRLYQRIAARRTYAIRAGIGLVIAIASIAWLVRSSELDRVLPLVTGAHPLLLTLSVLLLGFSLTLKSLRWRVLLPSRSGISRTEAYRIFHISILLNNLLPFRIGDGARVLAAPVRRAVTPQQALVVLVIERLLDAATLLVAALVVVPIFLRDARRPLDLPWPALPEVPQAVAVATVIGAILLVLAALAAEWRVSRVDVRAGLRRWLISVRKDVALLAQMPGRRLGMVGASTVTMWAGTVLLHYVLLVGLGASERTAVDPLLLALVVTLATNFAMLAPATPANIGLFHAAAAAPLMAAGLSTDVAVAYALLVHAVNTVPPMIVGTLCLGGPAVAARVSALRGHASTG